MLVLVIILVVDVPMIVGLVISHKQRKIDRRHFSAFVGYVAGVVTIHAILLAFLVAQPSHRSSLQEGLGFIAGAIVLTSWLVMILTGLFSSGVHRWLLLLYGIVTAFTYLLAAAGNFGA